MLFLLVHQLCSWKRRSTGGWKEDFQIRNLEMPLSVMFATWVLFLYSAVVFLPLRVSFSRSFEPVFERTSARYPLNQPGGDTGSRHWPETRASTARSVYAGIASLLPRFGSARLHDNRRRVIRRCSGFFRRDRRALIINVIVFIGSQISCYSW